MANHDLAIDTLLNNGLRFRKLDEVLASNCVMDWFGRTFIGQRRVIDFYQNTNSTHDHSMSTVKSTESFEDRPYHQLTRVQPLENMKNSPEMMTGDEQWFDCDTHTPINLNLKDGQRTPTHKVTPPRCPPAPSRHNNGFVDSDDDEVVEREDDLNESGIRPIDSTIPMQLRLEKDKSPDSKRLRTNEKPEPPPESIMSQPPAESKFSDLFYLEASGSVTINRQPTASDEVEKRDCKMLISYRVHKEDPTVVQIALIVYKSNSPNPKSRRNLILEFGGKASELVAAGPVNAVATSSSRSRSVVKDRKKFEESSARSGIASAPPGTKYTKAVKRPMISKFPARI